jgi:copper(I)-binding protein
VLVLAATLALVGTGGGAVLGQGEEAQGSPGALPTMAPMPTMGPGVLVHDAWTRESPMVDLAGAVFMVIDNTTTQDDALIGASSSAATVVELHQSSMADDGQMSMTPVESVPVPAGGTAVLEPGGYHVMLIGLVEPLEVGASIDVTLMFEHASPRSVSALVVPVGPMDTASAGGDDDSPDARPTPDSY